MAGWQGPACEAATAGLRAVPSLCSSVRTAGSPPSFPKEIRTLISPLIMTLSPSRLEVLFSPYLQREGVNITGPLSRVRSARLQGQRGAGRRGPLFRGSVGNPH